MRIAIDTNVLVYAEGVNDPARQAQADAVLVALKDHDLVLPVQVAGELFRVLTRKARMEAAGAGERLLFWQRTSVHQPASGPTTLAGAVDLVAAHRLDIWDALIVNAAAEAGCRLLLSEDMADGFVWRGVTVVDPFKAEPHPLLADLLARRPQ